MLLTGTRYVPICSLWYAPQLTDTIQFWLHVVVDFNWLYVVDFNTIVAGHGRLFVITNQSFSQVQRHWRHCRRSCRRGDHCDYSRGRRILCAPPAQDATDIRVRSTTGSTRRAARHERGRSRPLDPFEIWSSRNRRVLAELVCAINSHVRHMHSVSALANHATADPEDKDEQSQATTRRASH